MKTIKFYSIVSVLFIICTSQSYASLNRISYHYSVSVQFNAIDTEAPAHAPQPESLKMPDYPIEAIRAAISSDVIVFFTVTENGYASEIVVDEVITEGQTPPAVFASAAKAAVSKWLFTPGFTLKRPQKKYRFA